MTNAKTPARPRMHIDDCARLGKEIYEKDILPLVEDGHDGEYVSIDVNNGKWVVADSLLKATSDLRVKSPEAVDVWTERVGHRGVIKLGFRGTVDLIGTDWLKGGTRPQTGKRLKSNAIPAHNIHSGERRNPERPATANHDSQNSAQ